MNHDPSGFVSNLYRRDNVMETTVKVKSIPTTAQEFGRNPYVFVVGCPRSGTTLLQRMLDSHPVLEKFAPRLIADAIAGKDIPLTDKLAAGVRRYRRFHRLGVSAQEAEEEARKAKTYSEYVRALYTRFAALSGKPLAGDKTPSNVRHLPLLHGLFPEARAVHIIRDGRDVTLSVLAWAHESKGPGKLELWKEQPVAVCALWWRLQVRSGRINGVDIGADRYLEVLYEELVARPEDTLHQITDFLDLPYAHNMADYNRGKVRKKPGLSAKKAWLPPTPGLRNWRTDMKEKDIELFEAIAGDLLDELGHERTFPTISPAISDIAAMCEAWWETMLARCRAKARRRAGNHFNPLSSFSLFS
jgi:hypothetical protein